MVTSGESELCDSTQEAYEHLQTWETIKINFTWFQYHENTCSEIA